MEDWRKRISANPNVCHGQVCIAGTRIMVSIILGGLAGGESIADILKAYPSLSRADVDAALLYAAHVVDEKIEALPATPETAA